MTVKTRTTTVSAADRRLLELLARQDGRVRIRAKIILFLGEGKTQAEAAKKLETSAQTVSFWAGRYRDGGIAGLADAPRSGRPGSPKAVIEKVCKARLGEISAAADSAGVARSTAHRLRQQHPDLVPKPEKRNWPEPPPMASYQEHWHFRHGLRHTVWHKPTRKKEAEDDV